MPNGLNPRLPPVGNAVTAVILATRSLVRVGTPRPLRLGTNPGTTHRCLPPPLEVPPLPLPPRQVITLAAVFRLEVGSLRRPARHRAVTETGTETETVTVTVTVTAIGEIG